MSRGLGEFFWRSPVRLSRIQGNRGEAIIRGGLKNLVKSEAVKVGVDG
jgi:hypothetical protein